MGGFSLMEIEIEWDQIVDVGRTDASIFCDVYTDNPYKKGTIREQLWTYGVHDILSGYGDIHGRN